MVSMAGPSESASPEQSVSARRSWWRSDGERLGIIYGLHAPDGELRYVGQTRQRPRVRLWKHMNPGAANARFPVALWISKLARQGLEPALSIIAGPMRVDDLDEAERAWIAHYRNHGARLLNVADGGGGTRGLRWSAEQRERIAARMRGHVVSDETRQKMSKNGWRLTPEANAKRVATVRSRPKPETCVNGHPWTEETSYWYGPERRYRHCLVCVRARARARRRPSEAKWNEPQPEIARLRTAAHKHGAKRLPPKHEHPPIRVSRRKRGQLRRATRRSVLPGQLALFDAIAGLAP